MRIFGYGRAEVGYKDVPIQYELEISFWIDLIIPKKLIIFHQ